MQRISSRINDKHISLIGAIGIAILMIFASWPFVFPLLALAGGLFVFKTWYPDLADEVWIDGESLIVRKNGQEDRISFSHVYRVAFAGRPPVSIILDLDTRSLFGYTITFCAPADDGRFAIRSLVEDLLRRAESARGRMS